MAFSFGWFTDTALTVAATSLTSRQYFDGSGSYEDFTLYFGSTDSARKVEATSDPGVDQITASPAYLSTGRDAWAATTAYSLTNEVRTVATHNGYYYECTTAGTSGGSEPTWGTTIGGTTADGTVVWTCQGVQREIEEFKLATTQAGLTAATPGAGLDLGTSIAGGTGGKATVWVRVTNAAADDVDTSTDIACPQMESLDETAV